MSENRKHLASKHCHLCGRRLWGRGWVYAPNGLPDGQALVVCRQCRETAPRCDICGLPMGLNHVRLPDGRRICARCGQTAVSDPTRAQTLFERVARVVTDQLGLGLNVGTDFALVDPQHLQRLAEEAHPTLHDDPEADKGTSPPLGGTEGGGGDRQSPLHPKVVGLFIRKGRKRVMYILSGLPQIVLIHTMAHEWAHAWQGENCPLLQDSLVREGFAEWAAYKTLQTMGAVKKAALAEQRSGLYGEGLRAMLRLEREQGIPGVLDFCRRSE